MCRRRAEGDLKIAHVVRSDSFAGVERYICLVAPRLAARGCEVTVIGGDEARMRVITSSVRWRPATTTWAAAVQLARLGTVDVVHAHMTAAEAAAAFTKPRHRGRLVATLHFASERGTRTGWRFLRQLGRVIDEQIAVSRFVASAVPSTRVLPNGVEIADPGPPLRENAIVVMQRLEPEKQTDVALRAWSSSRLRRHGWRLVIAGRGSQLADLQRLSADLGLGGSVEWPGFLTDVTGLLSRAGAMLATAPAEPFGMTVVEAMARATPVIAADGGAHRETLGDDGWLFPVGDVDATVCLLDAVEGQDLRPYGTYLRARQQRLFEVENHADALLRIYQDLIA